MKEYPVQRAAVLKPKPDPDTLVFGKTFTDHMFIMDYTAGQGWHDPRIVPYAPLQIDPAAKVLHYAQEIFEGLKAYRTDDGSIQLFRPMDNIRRMNDSAERISLPQIPEELALAGITELVKLERDWVPHEKDTSLYIRPFMIGLDAALGVHSSHHCQYIVIVCPVGAYYPEGLNPVKIYVEDEYVRATPGGTGYIKCGGNYAASLLSGEKGHELGYSNIMYLDAAEHKYIEECGAANFFGIKEGKYVTPKSPSVLPSITNMSLRQLARDMGLTVEERHIPVEELATFEECGACGTAAVISPIGFVYDMQTKAEYSYGEEVGKTCLELYTRLQDIQYGRAEDKYGWCTIVL